MLVMSPLDRLDYDPYGLTTEESAAVERAFGRAGGKRE